MPVMRALHAAPLVIAVLVAFAPRRAAAEPPPSVVADRIVAVVGRDIILLSDVRAREAPFLLKLEQDKNPRRAGPACARRWRRSCSRGWSTSTWRRRSLRPVTSA